MEIMEKPTDDRPRLKAALFDFDGTISTLRHGWEGVMEPLMLEMIAGSSPVDDELVKEVREYIDQSTGIQTYYQMKWLAETVKKHGRNAGASEDPWWYKAEYNRRLMEPVEKRKSSILNGEKRPADFLMQGSEEFLQALDGQRGGDLRGQRDGRPRCQKGGGGTRPAEVLPVRTWRRM